MSSFQRVPYGIHDVEGYWDDLRFPASALGASELPPAWVQPTGGHDAYAIGALVTHNGFVWENTINANVWEPGVTGWTSLGTVEAYAGSGNAPTVDPDTGLWLFEDAKSQSVSGLAQMPHKWLEGTAVRPHVHWVQPAAGNVLWRLEYRVMPAVGGAFPGTWTTINNATGVSTYPGTGDWVQITAFGDIAMTGMSLSAMILFRLSRQGSDDLDTLAATVPLLEFDLHYQYDRGSREEFTK